FDKNFKAVQQGFVPLDDDANGSAMEISIPGQVVQQEGFAYVYLTNESNAEVYFDDIEVTVKESAVIQSNGYYPFGLLHANSWTRISDLKNNFLYNAGSELNEQTKNYETFYRDYDPALGRFNQIDPLASSFTNWTPYNYAFNDPVALNDPNGDCPGCYPLWERGTVYDPTRDTEGGAYGYGGRIGIGSGNHWSDQYRSVEGNLALMGTNTFRDFYGLDNLSDSELANFAIYSGLGSSNREDIESVTGWDFHDRYTHDGQGTSIPFVAVTSDGQWVGNLPIDIYQQSYRGPWIIPGSERYKRNNGIDWVGYAARQIGAQSLWLGATDTGAGYFMASRAKKILDASFSGTKATAQALGNSADKAPLFATRLLSGSNMARLAAFGRIAGPAGSLIGFGFSANKIVSGNGSAIDYLDAGVSLGSAAVGIAVIAGATISAPVLLAVGVGTAIYFTGRMAYDYFNDN
ncbi:MAG: RHS repeat-associated core domain-containing protein, partial [Bacteroidota bacterium]